MYAKWHSNVNWLQRNAEPVLNIRGEEGIKTHHTNSYSVANSSQYVGHILAGSKGCCLHTRASPRDAQLVHSTNSSYSEGTQMPM